MAEIIILKETLEESLRKKELGVLFRKSEYVNMTGINCDFVFHYLPINYERCKSGDKLLYIPVVNLILPEEEDLAKLTMSAIYRKMSIPTFAARKREKKGLGLDFFDVQKVEAGTEIQKRGKYYVASQEKCKSVFKNWEEMSMYFNELRQILNGIYS